MIGIHNHWAGQHRALTMQAVARRILLRLWGLGVAVICGIAFTTVSALAAAIVVPRDFPTIQAAVNAAAPGSTIRVNRGTYIEEIVIAKNLTLTGDGVGKTIIKSPPTLTPFAQHLLNGKPVGAVVRSTASAHVSMSGFTVTGPTPCAFNAAGFRVVKGATLDLSNSRVTHIRPADGTCPDGDALGAGIVFGLPDIIEIDGQAGSLGHGSASYIAVDGFQTTGIVVVGPSGGPPSTARISYNIVTGGTPFAVAGQVGISVAFAAVARVTENRVHGTVCTDPACGRDPINQAQSVGILTLFAELPGTELKENFASGNDIGLQLYGSGGCCQTRKNRLSSNRFFGIVIQDGSNNTADNVISGGEVGIGVVADFVNTVAVLHGDKIRETSVLPVQEISCCGFTATAIIKAD